ncbi:MAG: hypothetical protein ABSG78_16485 [Verrucomicrobiota bacterium]|jgi:hypothetical protein
MESSLVKCGKCQAILFPESFNTGRFFPCPSCEAPLAVEVFPAILQTPSAAAAEPLLVQGQSSCFYHPAKKASIVCDGCGRFLCGLCDLELNGRHLCPACLEAGQKKSKFKDLENTRVLWDHIALAVALFPLLCFWPSFIGAPYALYLVLRYRKAPCSITGKSNLAFAAAGVLALLECVGWVIFIIYLITKD